MLPYYIDLSMREYATSARDDESIADSNKANVILQPPMRHIHTYYGILIFLDTLSRAHIWRYMMVPNSPRAFQVSMSLFPERER